MKNNYNERSWAIDVITEISLIGVSRKKKIRRAGGERTLKASTKASSLFPDILLFEDDDSARVIQGWELKMPDTSINDAELISNATKKAKLLNLNSFVLWNVTEAVLYVEENGVFTIKKSWVDLNDIKLRSEVESNRDRWKAMLQIIVDDLEDFFAKGEIKSQNILESLSENNIIDVVTNNVGLVQQKLKIETQQNALLDAQIEDWWENIKVEYSSEPNALAAVSKLALITWVNRFLFTHYLKKFTNKALEIDNFTDATTIQEAKTYFNELTSESDFLNVFSDVLGEEYIDDTSWDQILQLNAFLSELKLEGIDQALLQQFFEKLLLVSKRKTAGQYATPYPLADFLSRIVILDRTKIVSDPFCGTGTILRASFDLKLEAGISAGDAIDCIWGSDKFSFPLQMSTLSLAKPEVMGKVINVFKSDVKDLSTGSSYDFIDPNTGATITKSLPKFDYVISNLPFVKSDMIKKANPDIINIQAKMRLDLANPKFKIDKRSDLIAYLPYYLWHLIADNGRIGIIISNSWLGTEWGDEFRVTLNRYFKITQVITSASGRWFDNAKVITNLVVLEKRSSTVVQPASTEQTTFATLTIPISSLENKATVSKVVREVLLKKNGLVNLQTFSKQQMDEFAKKGLGWSAYFAKLDWFNTVKAKIIKTNTLFHIARGERRGWDPMFYPSSGHGIELKYIKPVLKNMKLVKGVIATANDEAFCCSESIANMQANGDTGALAWINKFINGNNNSGKPLPQVLKKANHYWYEMKDATVADLVAQINYGQTLTVAKMTTRSFVNQRLIRFTAINSSVDIDLCHALLNSFIGMYYMEAMGFGRGQGALDLNSDKLQLGHCMLDPSLLNSAQITSIKLTFSPLLGRNIQIVPVEVTLSDRLAFEAEVAKCYGLSGVWNDIKNCLLILYKIRDSV